MFTTIYAANATLTRKGWTRTTDAGTAVARAEWDGRGSARRMRLAISLNGRPLCDLSGPLEFIDGKLVAEAVSDDEILADIDAAISGAEPAALRDRMPTTLYDYAALSRSWVDDLPEGTVVYELGEADLVDMSDEPMTFALVDEDGDETPIAVSLFDRVKALTQK